MLGSAVPFMPGETVARILLIILRHDVVPGLLGNDGSRCNGKREAVAVDDAAMCNVLQRCITPIDEQIVRKGGQAPDSLSHGF